MELYEHPDLGEWVERERRHREWLRREWDAGRLDGSTFARADSACRMVLAALGEAVEIREGRSRPTSAFEASVRAAADAVRRLNEWQRLDNELRELLEGS